MLNKKFIYTLFLLYLVACTPAEQNPSTPTSLPATPISAATEPTPAVACLLPPDLAETKINITDPDFCVVWVDEFEDEKQFVVKVSYENSGENFVYELPANSTQLILPPADAPRLAESLEQCQQRQSYTIEVIAERDTTWPVGQMTMNSECGGLDVVLPTATP